MAKGLDLPVTANAVRIVVKAVSKTTKRKIWQKKAISSSKQQEK